MLWECSFHYISVRFYGLYLYTRRPCTSSSGHADTLMACCTLHLLEKVLWGIGCRYMPIILCLLHLRSLSIQYVPLNICKMSCLSVMIMIWPGIQHSFFRFTAGFSHARSWELGIQAEFTDQRTTLSPTCFLLHRRTTQCLIWSEWGLTVAAYSCWWFVKNKQKKPHYYPLILKLKLDKCRFKYRFCDLNLHCKTSVFPLWQSE